MVPGNLQERKSRLKALWSAVEKHEQEILDALYADLAKPEAEALLHEIYPLKKEIQYALHHILQKQSRSCSTQYSLKTL